VIQWGLNKSVGDTLQYQDERGRKFNIKLVAGLANSILQGRVLISEQAFLNRFPSINGSRVLLVDAPPEEAGKIGRELAFSLEDAGLELTPAIRRLAEFSEVENTYLSVFMLLGGLGLAVGSIGLAVVVMRNVLERRGELALMRALGFRRGTLRRFLLMEHSLLLLAAMGAGLLPALLAVQPAMHTSGVDIPYAVLGLILGGIVCNGLFWILIAAWITTREELLPALRDE
jgi:ABC-type antimicrobial peptide transport system permease subunit